MLPYLFSLTQPLLTLFSGFSGSSVPPPAGIISTLVNLRIEGAEKTIFEGPVFTRGHNVTTASGGNHHCDGTNNHINPHPGPTCTSALDDAATTHDFTFDGEFFTKYDDFLNTSIDGEAQTATQFWNILLNFQFTQYGGCQQRVNHGDHVLFAFDAFKKAHILKLAGPHIAHVDQAVTLTVTDGRNGSVVAGAEVNGQISDVNGHISVTFSKVGLNRLKAEKSDSVRSNQIAILVV